MVKLCLDIETYRPRKRDAFINEKVIAIGILEQSEQLFTIWRLGSEENVVKKFYNYFEEMVNNSFIEVIGFNILRMDIPLLIQKGVEYKIKDIEELNVLWHNTFTIDLFQALLPANQYRFKGLKLPKIMEILKEKIKDNRVPQLKEHGEEIAKAYREKRYKDIERWLKQDLYATKYLYEKTIDIIKLFLMENKPLISSKDI